MRHMKALIATLLILSLSFPTYAQQAKAQPERTLPGQKPDSLLLSNGWRLTPEGKQIPTSDLPMNMELSKDGRFLLVTTNGNGHANGNGAGVIEEPIEDEEVPL